MTVWDCVYIQLCGWVLHPGYKREGASAPSFAEIAVMCDAICAEISKRREANAVLDSGSDARCSRD